MEITLASAALIPVVVAITQAIKKAGIASRFIPLLSIVLGIAIVWVTDLSAGFQLLEGIVIGTSASGLYDVGTKTVK